MLCGTCGSETPVNSRFCHICGDSFSVVSGRTVAMHGRPVATSRQSKAMTLVGALLLLGLAYYAYATHCAAATHYAISILDRTTKKPHQIPLSNRTLTINQLGYSYFRLEVPAKASTVSLRGSFSASGETGNTIEAFVFSESDYANWVNRHTTKPFYSSGKVTMSTIDADLPAGAGEYYLVFNNKFSVLGAKTIHVDAALRYYE
jgi:hypothetical protein